MKQAIKEEISLEGGEEEAQTARRAGLEAYPDAETLLEEMRELTGAVDQIMSRAIEFGLRLRASISKLQRAARPPEPPSPHAFPKMTAAEFKDLLTRKEVAEQLGVCTMTLRKMYEEGRFPMPIQLSSRKLRFRRTEVEQWMRGEND